MGTISPYVTSWVNERRNAWERITLVLWLALLLLTSDEHSIAIDQRVPTSLALLQDYIKDSKPGIQGEEI